MRVPTLLILGIVALGMVLPASSAQAAEGLNLFPNPPVLLLNLVIFGILIYPVNRLLLRPLVRVLAEREARTDGALERTEQVLAEVNELRERFEARLRDVREQGAERRASVLAQGETEERHVLDRAREDAGGVIEQVRQGVAAELEAARQALTADASDLAREAASKILGRSL